MSVTLVRVVVVVMQTIPRSWEEKLDMCSDKISSKTALSVLTRLYNIGVGRGSTNERLGYIGIFQTGGQIANVHVRLTKCQQRDFSIDIRCCGDEIFLSKLLFSCVACMEDKKMTLDEVVAHIEEMKKDNVIYDIIHHSVLF